MATTRPRAHPSQAENEVARASKLLAQFEADKAQFNATIQQLTAEVEMLRGDIAAKDRENERLQDALAAIRGGGSAGPSTRRSGGAASSGKRRSVRPWRRGQHAAVT